MISGIGIGTVGGLIIGIGIGSGRNPISVITAPIFRQLGALRAYLMSHTWTATVIDGSSFLMPYFHQMVFVRIREKITGFYNYFYIEDLKQTNTELRRQLQEIGTFRQQEYQEATTLIEGLKASLGNLTAQYAQALSERDVVQANVGRLETKLYSQEHTAALLGNQKAFAQVSQRILEVYEEVKEHRVEPQVLNETIDLFIPAWQQQLADSLRSIETLLGVSTITSAQRALLCQFKAIAEEQIDRFDKIVRLTAIKRVVIPVPLPILETDSIDQAMRLLDEILDS